MQIRVSILLILITVIACVEDYSPNIIDYINMPVVEGEITNEPGPYIIKLSTTTNVYDLDYVPLTGANVTIYDDLNNEEQLIELEPGGYSIKASGIQGIIGRSYRLSVEYNNEVYQSDFEKLIKPVKIDSVFSNIEYKQTNVGVLKGLQCYVELGNNADKDTKLIWRPVETYEYEANLTLNFIYYLDTTIAVNGDFLKVCWHTENIFDIFTFSAQNFNGAKVNFPLNFVSSDNKKLSKKYSLLVKQYTISDDAYNYWSKIKEQNEKKGDLYTKQPFQIKGNLKNLHAPQKNILGYFLVAGVSSRRVFLAPSTFEDKFPNCSLESYNIDSAGASKDMSLHWPFYGTILSDGSIGIAELACFDCQSEGGTLNKPDFWEN